MMIKGKAKTALEAKQILEGFKNCEFIEVDGKIAEVKADGLSMQFFNLKLDSPLQCCKNCKKYPCEKYDADTKILMCEDFE